MSASALILVLLAGLVHAAWNLAAKKAGGDARFTFLATSISLLVWSPLAWWFGAGEVTTWGWQQWSLVGLSGLMQTFYFVALLRGYGMADLTLVYPLARGSGPLIATAVAVLALGEPISVLGLSGMAAVVLGICLLAGLTNHVRGMPHRPHSSQVRKGVFYGLLTGLCIASYTVTDSIALNRFGMAPASLLYCVTWAVLLYLLPAVLSKPHELAAICAKQWRYAVVVGVAGPVSYVLVLFALRQAPLSHVAPAREVAMLFAAMLGGRFLGEENRAARIAGAVSMGLGIVALAWG